jgi:16S rRNA (cytidine1402-2'-O)-methyltransferase
MASNRGSLYVVATPIGNLEDITLRALRVLREVDLVAAEDTRRTIKLLNHYQISTRLTSLHEHNERGRIRPILDALESGKSVALVSDAGTPTVSDPGAMLVTEAVRAGIHVVPVPGASAALAALTVAGVELDGGFTFLGFPPARSKDRKTWFARLETTAQPAVFFEAPHRIRQTLKEIGARLGDRPITLARELTKIHETVIRGSTSEVLAQLGEPRGEMTIVIGQIPANMPAQPTPISLTPAQAVDEFGQLIENERLSRREAVSMVASRHGMSARAVYALIEAGKNRDIDQ